MIYPGEALKVQRLVKDSRVVQLAGLGHLAHEEDPQRVTDEVLKYLRSEAPGIPLDSSPR
jgi:pimeloyl-ACP methyl ester carboxylesterase